MMDTLLSGADRKEALSRVYVKALAARAGYATSVPEPDRDSVDLRIHGGGLLRPALDLQLKATTNIAEPRDGLLPFRLSIKNYRDLSEDTQTPRLLVVLELPTERTAVDDRAERRARAPASGLLAEFAAGPRRGSRSGVDYGLYPGAERTRC